MNSKELINKTTNEEKFLEFLNQNFPSLYNEMINGCSLIARKLVESLGVDTDTLARQKAMITKELISQQVYILYKYTNVLDISLTSSTLKLPENESPN